MSLGTAHKARLLSALSYASAPPPPARSHRRGCVPKSTKRASLKGAIIPDFLAATVALRHGEAARCLLLMGMLVRGPPPWWGGGGGRETGSCLWGRDVHMDFQKKLKKAHMQERRRPAEQPGAWQSNQRLGMQRGSAQGWAHRTWWPGGSPSTSGALLFFKSPGGKSTVDTSWFCWL